MAGLEENFQGRADLSRGYRSGMVAQEPLLAENLTVRQNLEIAFSKTMALLREYEELTVKMGEQLSEDQMQKAMERMGELQDKIVSRTKHGL
jgi:ATPase subunit of ABC transporter with duplicated ATPase domains